MMTKYSFKDFFAYFISIFFPKKEELFGILNVSGKGTLEFKFKHYVEDIFVFFDDDILPSPCNPCDPGKDDDLDWYIYYRHGHYFLVISWDVSSQRTIKWQIYSPHHLNVE